MTEARFKVEIPQGDMEQVRQNTLIKWNRAMINLGPVPDNNRLKITKGLVGCFTHRDNTGAMHAMCNSNASWTR